MTPQACSAQGLYVHVPFCASRCIYCDFYSTTRGADVRRDYVRALERELQRRSAEAEGRALSTVYLGGGTPSQLAEGELQRIFEAIHLYYKVADDAEITVEANPDDVTDDWVRAVKSLGVNRVSLGVQTFDDDLLRLIHRRHTALQARRAVERIHDTLTHNISIDLIYGLPTAGCDAMSLWGSDLDKAFSLPVTHLSAYALSYEEGTQLWRLRSAGQVQETADDVSLAMYHMLLQRTHEEGFEHYEISNFSRPGCRSRHNSSYWQGAPYIGAGPGAHSYDGRCLRRQNSPDLARYIAASPDVPHVFEHLTPTNLYDEFVMTRLRTCEGIPLDKLTATQRDYLLRQARPHVERGTLRLTSDRLVLTRDGLFLSDGIMADLMGE